MSGPQILIGTRGSKLALAQAGQVRAAIAAALGSDEAAALRIFSTAGDRIQDRTLTEIGGKALFTLEIEAALRSGEVQCAVHSMKDMPADDPEGLVIAAVPAREDPRDAFICEGYASLSHLPGEARLGTASLRRQAQALHRRPDLAIVPLRGNVDTRLSKMRAGEADAIILAQAGLNRLGLGGLARELIDPVAAPPAPAQGALAIQTRVEDAGAPWLKALEDRATRLAITAERSALSVLEGSCRTAIGAFARIEGQSLSLVIEALTPRGDRRFRRSGEVSLTGGDVDALTTARDVGRRLAQSIHDEAGDALTQA